MKKYNASVNVAKFIALLCLLTGVKLFAQTATMAANFPSSGFEAPANIGIYASANVNVLIPNIGSSTRNFTLYITWVVTMNNGAGLPYVSFHFFDVPIAAPPGGITGTLVPTAVTFTNSGPATGTVEVKATLLENDRTYSDADRPYPVSGLTGWVLTQVQQVEDQNEH